LNKLNDTGEEMEESSQSEAVAAEAAAAAAAVAAEAVKAAAAVAATAVEAAAVAATAVEAAAVAAAAVLQPPPPVVYSNYTRPSLIIEFDKDAFKVNDRYGKLKSNEAARMGRSRAVNMFVNTILGEYFSKTHTQKELVLALHE
jgi:hypothetical protein